MTVVSLVVSFFLGARVVHAFTPLYIAELPAIPNAPSTPGQIIPVRPAPPPIPEWELGPRALAMLWLLNQMNKPNPRGVGQFRAAVIRDLKAYEESLRKRTIYNT